MIVDSHAHVFDVARFPLAAGQGYHPKPHEAGTLPEYLETLDAHGVDAALLVQPSGYGTDNAAVLDALKRHPGRFPMIHVKDFLPAARSGAATGSTAEYPGAELGQGIIDYRPIFAAAKIGR